MVETDLQVMARVELSRRKAKLHTHIRETLRQEHPEQSCWRISKAAEAALKILWEAFEEASKKGEEPAADTPQRMHGAVEEVFNAPEYVVVSLDDLEEANNVDCYECMGLNVGYMTFEEHKELLDGDGRST